MNPINMAQKRDNLPSTVVRIPKINRIVPKPIKEYQKMPSQTEVGDFRLA